MPFNSLLLVNLITETHLSQCGVKVSMMQEAGEKVLFFDMMDPNVARDSLNIKRAGKICDGLVFYCRGNEKTCCFVELKGSKLETAIKQVINTYEYLKQEMKISLGRMGCQALLKQISWKAYICTSGSVPRETKSYAKLLEATFGKGNYDIQGESDLGVFLRKQKKR
jgi:hypothetical protein